MRTRIFAAALTAVFLFVISGPVTAYAQDGADEPFIKGGGPAEMEYTAPIEAEYTAPPIIPVIEEAPPARPFTPPGTGTVVDNVTNEDGKEFFTITSAAGNIFFLVIDRQRDTENVYFLNAVTERDLLALAEESGETWETVSTPPPIIPEPAPIIEPVEVADPEPEPAPEPEQGGGNMGLVIILAVVIIGGGGAGWYFKIYRPKQQSADTEDEFDYADDADPADLYGTDINAISSWDVEDEAE